MSDLRVVVGALVAAAAVVAGTAVARDAGGSPFPAPGPGFGAGPVTPGTPRTAAWTEASAGLAPGVDPTRPEACRAGTPACVDAVVAEMEARLAALGCRRTAPFAFTYLRMTEGVGRRVAEPGFFADPAALAHLDALFARLYFTAFDNWAAGRVDEVPGAWQMAFEAADTEAVSAAADLLLGMNAHISRDLAYTVAAVLEGAPGMAADEDDFRAVNAVIAEVRQPMLAEAADRFDPMLAELEDALAPGTGPDAAALIGLWRERAFAAGQRLAEAPTPTARRAVEAEIERTAVASAAAILDGDAVLGRGLDATDRSRYCERPRG